EVYRIYRRPGHDVTSEDRRWLAAAAAAAKPRLQPRAAQRLDDLFAALVDELPPGSPQAMLAMRWQQLTSPATAKGVEDTAIYTPGGLLALADVGSEPDGTIDRKSMDAFLADRARTSPYGLSALSTHDSKRSCDARCRLAALSEFSERWCDVVDRLERHAVGDQPDAADRRYFYQSALAIWPLDGQEDANLTTRLVDHMTKASREAKRHTSWTAPDAGYESAMTDFVETFLADGQRTTLLAAIVEEIAPAAVARSLAAVVLRAISPGVPDVYQGDDQWMLALVDPDNRGNVDVAAHFAGLRALPDLASADLVTNWQNGRVKQLTVRNSLRWRRGLTEPSRMQVDPLVIEGPGSDAGYALRRGAGSGGAVGVITKAPGTIAGPGAFATGDVWKGTDLDVSPLGASALTDVLTGQVHKPTASGRVALSDVLSVLPVALLSATAG
ncbi:MAG: hypothetical protein JO214_08920, partial [Frankiaceae bacterium]|nr:hypothetical protein [Frankiaceae bacterium]